MIRTKYGQAPKRHARQGIKSCMYFVLAAFVLLLMVSVSFAAKGKVGILVGFAGLLCLLWQDVGWRQGYAGSKREIRIT